MMVQSAGLAGKTLNPYQGLKQVWHPANPSTYFSAGKTLNPYQGLKPD